jgi:2-polyprenyl-3-methyl-5-hydroxy-6-metoxy-1,4-benzoquinol methylase
VTNEIVKSYGWVSSEGPCSCPYLAPRVLKLVSALGANRVCDVGSGNGALAGMLSACGYHVVGTEVDKDGVELATRTHPSVRFYNLGVGDDPSMVVGAEGGLFDVVVSTEVVEHLFSPHELPAFASKLLRPGGSLVISTPYHGFVKNMALSLTNKWDSHHTALWHGGHIKFWSRKTLTALLENEGFEVVEFHGAGRIPWLWKGMILVARWT